MKAQRAVKALFIVAVLIVSVFGVMHFSDSSDAAVSDIQLYAVKPTQSDEGFSLINNTGSDVNLKDYKVTNGTGTVSFTTNLILPAGKSMVILKDASTSPYFITNAGDSYKTWGEDGITGDNFEINDSAFALYLKKGDTTIDAFFYGNVTVDDTTHWTGRTFTPMGEQANAFVLRTSSDILGVNAWHRWGTTSSVFDKNLKFDAEVTPFLLPECGGIPIFEALKNAKTSVCISIYMIDSPLAIGWLAECAKRGVAVKLLVEGHTGGSYLSGDSENAKMLRYLVDCGAEVKVMTRADENSPDLHRYYYLHTKYCIIDNETTIVMSENWDTHNITNKVITDPYSCDSSVNRGWGVVVKSTGYAKYMMDAFNNDIDTKYGDVFDFKTVYPSTSPKDVLYKEPTEKYETKTYTTTVTPVLSPDNSWDATLSYIDSAETRVYVEMLTIMQDYIDENYESPVSHLIKKAETADVQILLCMGNDKDGVLKQVNYFNNNTKINARYMSAPYLHNKGLVFDNTAFVSTINWTSTGFLSNREVGVIINSSEVADFYASSFEKDFDNSKIAKFKIEPTALISLSAIAVAMIVASGVILLLQRRRAL